MITRIYQDLENFPDNKLVTKEMLMHQVYKLYHGFTNTKKHVWIKKMFFENLIEMIPFLIIYPVEVTSDFHINRKTGIGVGLNQEDIKIFDNHELIKNEPLNPNSINDTPDTPITILCNPTLKTTNGYKLYIITIRINKPYLKIKNIDLNEFYEIGFVKKNNINYLIRQDFKMELFYTLVEKLVNYINLIVFNNI